MRSTKLFRVAAVTACLGLVAAACGSDDDSSAGDTTAASADSTGTDEPANSGETVGITILGTLKAEIEEPFAEAVEAYNASQSAYELESLPLGGGEFLQTATGLYSSGNAPTIMVMQQEIPEFQDRLLDLAGTAAIEAALPGTLDLATLDDGRIVGAPQTIEAYGLLYNQAVLDEAVGGTFDPASIATRSDLAALFEQIDALDSTQAAIQVSPMDWSLGAHLTNSMYAAQSADRGERLAFMDELKAGSVTLTDDPVFTGWLDTVDLMLEYNQLKSSPLDGDYDPAVLALSSGEVGFWFMGNWAVPNLLEAAPDGSFGILPLPVSDDPADYGNTQVAVGVPAYIVVDAEQSSAEQQAGAIDFINWLTTTDEGKVFYSEKFEFLPAYADMADPTASMNQQIVDYASSGATLEWMNSVYPIDGWPTFGASMQKYISGNIDRDGLAGEFQDYWTTVE
ncbi:ABC transporter substrate-binding protein [Ilumatobacter coccineus]|uniref:Sugar ABC transporter sugar-binding protein n=1 Tax=Ilumatobacter coccineus (strain NBRC 103263 / KCTC 29153 / YM16-304) TaxID=1313172 RepID=A0A6C7EHW0_ILUCY|nr:ABC transporter substrate-binding protein [Ilumatobacter coccineus]BAN03566.1 sugar ABC transporter sugar-binding protein [Ilumatobacter coccineus YM16-304]